MGLDEQDKMLWIQFSEAWHKYIGMRMLIYQDAVSLPEIVKYALKHRPPSLGAALELVKMLNPEQLKMVLPELLDWAVFDHGSMIWFHEQILRIPLDWLKNNIEIDVERFLNLTGDNLYVEYACLLQLYSKIDHDLTLRLAERALQHSDRDVQDMGEFWKSEMQNIKSDKF
jgi:hypothetical protein